MVDAVDGMVGYVCCVVWLEICVVFFFVDGNMCGVFCGWKYVWMEICVVFFCGWKYVWWLDSSNGCNAEEQLSRRSNLRCSDNMLHKSYLFSFIY